MKRMIKGNLILLAILGLLLVGCSGNISGIDDVANSIKNLTTDSNDSATVDENKDETQLVSYDNFSLESDEYSVVNAQLSTGRLEGTNSLEFSGEAADTNYALLPYDSNYDMQTAGSLAVWVKARSIVPYSGIICKGEKKDFSDQAYGIQLWKYENSNARLMFFLYDHDDSNNWVATYGTFDLQIDTWYYVVVTWDDTNMNLYVNGQLDSTQAHGFVNGIKTSDGGITVGAQLTEKYNDDYGNLSWDGYIDSFEIYNRCLTSEDVQEKYNSSL